MKNVLICNQKGGTGKSMLSDELAFALDRRGIAYSFLDIDPQIGTLHTSRHVDGAPVRIIDTPGALTNDVFDLMSAADVIVIPFRPGARDFGPLQLTVNAARTHGRTAATLCVMNMWNRYKTAQMFETGVRDLVNSCDGFKIIPQSEAVSQAAVVGVSVIEYAPRSTAAAAVADVTDWIINRLGV